ncbi:MAG: phosphate ABC transporter permease subunit PstC [Lentisphaerae bacterium GWF2_52_8]|nr:MAG: phosphate ABC transporter permease subunit PstC [Lentisphaerae bacterium GWF2_52_8]
MPVKKMRKVLSLPDSLFHWLTMASALMIIVLMISFFAQLLWYSLPSIREFGWGFVLSQEWDPVRNLYGAAGAIYGTLVTTLIAMLIAAPLSFGIALFLVEFAPPYLSRVLGQAIDLLAAVPSIIYGMWGLFVFVPIMQKHVQPFLADTLGLKALPFFSGPQMGFGLLTSGIILALMILPFISAVMRDVFRMVPPVVKESAYGTGATTWEVTADVTTRYGMQGLLGALFLGLGRAIGETMAVLFIIGHVQQVSFSLFAPGTTISATLANNFAEAEGISKSVLFELGLILLVISFLIQIAAQYWLNKVRRSTGGGL